MTRRSISINVKPTQTAHSQTQFTSANLDFTLVTRTD